MDTVEAECSKARNYWMQSDWILWLPSVNTGCVHKQTALRFNIAVVRIYCCFGFHPCSFLVTE